MTLSLGTRHDEMTRLGAAAAAVMVTFATALTSVSLLASNGPGDTGAAGSIGAGTLVPAPGTLAVAAPATAHSALPRSAPAGLSIPALGLDTGSVTGLGRTASGTMEVPGHAATVGWIESTPAPGEHGASVLMGHTRFAYERGAFAGISRLRRGNTVAVRREDGVTAVFTVYRVEHGEHHLGWERVTAPSGRPELRLLTTAGAFEYGTDDGSGAVLVRARLTGTE